MPWTQDAGLVPAQSGAQTYRDLTDNAPLGVFGRLAHVLAAAKLDVEHQNDSLGDLSYAVSPNATDPLAKARVGSFLSTLGEQQSTSNPEHADPNADPLATKAHAAAWEVSKLIGAHGAGMLSGRLQDLTDRLVSVPERLTDQHLGELQQLAPNFQEHTAGLDPDLKLPAGFRFVRIDGGPDGVRPFVEVNPAESKSQPQNFESGPANASPAWFAAKQPWDSAGQAPSLVKLLAGAREGERLAVVKNVPQSDHLVASPNPDGTMALFGKEAPKGFYPAQDLKQGLMHRLIMSVPTVVSNIDDLLNQIAKDPQHIQSHSSPAPVPAMQDGNHIVVEGKPEHLKAMKIMAQQAGFQADEMMPFREQTPDGQGGVTSQRRSGVIVRLGDNPSQQDTQRAWDLVQKAKSDFYDVSPVAYLHGAAPSGSQDAWDNVYVDPAGRQVVHRTVSADPSAPNSVRASVPAGTVLGSHEPNDASQNVNVNGNQVLVNNRLRMVVQQGQVEQADGFLSGQPSSFRMTIPAHPYRQDGAQPDLPTLTFGTDGPVSSRTVVGHVSNGRVTLEAPSDPEDVGQMLLHQARLVLGSVGVKA